MSRLHSMVFGICNGMESVVAVKIYNHQLISSYCVHNNNTKLKYHASCCSYIYKTKMNTLTLQ